MTKMTHKSFKPYKKIHFGSNVLENVESILEIGKEEPFVVGKGASPLVWLKAPKEKGTSWLPVVKKSTTKFKDKLKILKSHRRTEIKLGDVVVFSGHETGEDEISIEKFDMRPLGLLFYLDEDTLHFGNTKFSRSGFKNLKSMIHVD